MGAAIINWYLTHWTDQLNKDSSKVKWLKDYDEHEGLVDKSLTNRKARMNMGDLWT